MSLSHLLHNLIINLYSSYNHKKMRHKNLRMNEFARLKIIVFRVPGYPRVIILTRALPAGKILYPYPPVKFYTHTLTHQIGYPRVPTSAGKIAIPN